MLVTYPLLLLLLVGHELGSIHPSSFSVLWYPVHQFSLVFCKNSIKKFKALISDTQNCEVTLKFINKNNTLPEPYLENFLLAIYQMCIRDRVLSIEVKIREKI